MADDLQLNEPQPPPGFRPLEEGPPKGYRTLSEGEALTLGFTPLPEPPQTVGRKIVTRFLGTDVDDPLAMTRTGTAVIGAVAGGVAGSRVPTAPGPAGLIVNPVTGALVFGGVGAVGGAVSPEYAMEAGEALGLLEAGFREKHGLSPEELRTVAEGEALLEMATGGGLSIMRFAGRGATRLLAGTGRELAEAGARQGIALLPVQVGNRQIARGYVAVMGRIPWIGPPLRRGGAAAEAAMQARVEGLPARFAPVSAWSELSESMHRDAKALVRSTNDRFGRLYTDLFARAEAAGVRVVPAATLTKADEILAKIASQTPVSATGEAATPGKALEGVKAFIESEILSLRATVPGATVRAQQSLRQMDGLISKIDQEIAGLEPGQKKFAYSLLNQLRQAAQLDAISNVRGPGSSAIAAELKTLDREFSYTMSQLFETAAAKKFGSVERRGLRGVKTDAATRTPVDQLANLVVKLDSPQAIEELSRLITPETFGRVTAKVFDEAMRLGRKGENFDIDAFAKHLGLDDLNSSRRQTVEMMLDKSGVGLTIDDLDDLVTAGRAIASVEIPNVSTFIARRATISGVRGVINGVVPGLALAGSGTVGAWAGGTLVGAAVFVGGGRLISAMLANPASARQLRKVLGKEATTLVRREAFVGALRTGIVYLEDQAEISTAEAQRMYELTDEMIDGLAAQFNDMGLTD